MFEASPYMMLQIHNTFGERHVHILEVGRNEEAPNVNFDHQWSFHVLFTSHHSMTILAHTPSPRLQILGIPMRQTRCPIQDTHRTRSSRDSPIHPLLTAPRILRQAAVLHYRHHLDVYKRPEPKPVSWSASPSYSLALAKGGGTGWQHPTILERGARHFVNAFLARRAHALGVCIKPRPGDPSAHVQHFDAGTDGADAKLRDLVISYLSPHSFTLLVLAGDGPTALHWGGSGGPSHATGEVREFLASNEALFRDVFDVRESGATWPARVLRLLPDAARGMNRLLEVGRPRIRLCQKVGWLG
ncbi:hypothetical protein BGW80DRAFT_1461600 [Lactifluus volemus]|nr:hypothetical protein BGW80DRAFT_1461600 [Lactifluus volemus]